MNHENENYGEPTGEPIDVPSQAVTVRDAVTALEPAKEQARPVVTAAQAKVEAIANLTAAAYSRASELRLTPEESNALQAPFGDECFQTGAGGKENLIYIQHSALRDRFNKVLGLGQWSIIPRSRWAQEERDSTTVYVEAMLLIRGCFVAESIGDMVYWPKNRSTNYGDAVEGATTQAFRRCAKMFGVGLQAWDKAWCEGWWQRRRTPSRPQQAPSAPPAQRQQAPPPQAAPKATTQPGGEQTFPVVVVVSVKEVHSKPDVKVPWTAYFVTFDDGIGKPFEAATFDKKIAAVANELGNTQETARLTIKPGRKPDTREIVSLVRAEEPPQSDTVPMDFDDKGNPVQEGVTP